MNVTACSAEGPGSEFLSNPIAYSNPGQLVSISFDGAITAPAYEFLRNESNTIERSALFVNHAFNLGISGETERIPAARVSSDLFRVLGVHPVLGRTFTKEEDVAGNSNVVILGDAIWRQRFGADPDIINKEVLLTGVPHTIIGVMPPGFRFPDGPELPVWVGTFPPAEMWRPMALMDWERRCESCFNFMMIARLRPGVTPSGLRSELSASLEKAMKARGISSTPGLTITVLKEAVIGKVRPAIAILFGSVTLALLIVCVNIANLLLARGLKRRSEIAIRLALGATRGRIMRQLLTEASVLAIGSAVLAIPIAHAGVKGLIAIAPAGIPLMDTITIDIGILGFTFLLALVTALLFGALPAYTIARRSPGITVKSGGPTFSNVRSRLSPALVLTEFALCLVLLVASAHLASSFFVVTHVPLGFNTENILTMQIPLDGLGYNLSNIHRLAARLRKSCENIPDVLSAAAINTLPLTNQGEGHGLIAEDSPDPNRYIMLRYRTITPSYFRTVGIRLIKGREFKENESLIKPVAIISETGARQLWPDISNPIGRKIREGSIPTVVIGIVEDTHASGLDKEVLPYIYVPFTQYANTSFALVVRTAADPAIIAAAVKREIRRIDKNLPVSKISTMQQLVSDSISSRRFQTILMELFAGFALILVLIGLYGVMSYSVTQRTNEIGIRIALGSSRTGILARVMREAMILALSGIILGLLAAFFLIPLLRNLLFGVSAGELLIFAGCSVLLVMVAAAASLIPALRAASVDPVISLRYE